MTSGNIDQMVVSIPNRRFIEIFHQDRKDWIASGWTMELVDYIIKAHPSIISITHNWISDRPITHGSERVVTFRSPEDKLAFILEHL